MSGEGDEWIDISDTQLAAIRNEVVEECAKVADLYPGVYGNSPTAAEIRKLKR